MNDTEIDDGLNPSINEQQQITYGNDYGEMKDNSSQEQINDLVVQAHETFVDVIDGNVLTPPQKKLSNSKSMTSRQV